MKKKLFAWCKNHLILTVVIILILISGFFLIKDSTKSKAELDFSPHIINQSSAKPTSELGDLIVSGEEDGICYVKDINMWSEPKSATEGAYVVGRILNACPKTTVSYYDVVESTSRTWYLVKSNGQEGWITDTFVIGKK